MNEWSQHDRELVIELRQKTDLTFQEIADHLKASGLSDRTSKACAGVWRRYIASQMEEIEEEEFEEEEVDVYEELEVEKEDTSDSVLKQLEEMRKELLEEIKATDQYTGLPRDGAELKVVTISDAHIPFINGEVFQDLLDNHSDADVLVINGDFLELYSVSSWPKNKTIMLRHEYEQGMYVLKQLASIFPKIILTKGNHEDRLQRHFAANIDPSISFMTSPDLLHRMANGYDFDEDGELVKMYDFDNVHYNKGQLAWYTKVGKCIFAHPSGGSGVPMRTSIKAAEYFLTRNVEFDAIVVGHTHQMGSIIWNKKLVIEQGCACVPMEYEATSKMAYRPQAFGYAVVYMDEEGNVDFDKSGPVYCGTGSVAESVDHLI